MKEVVTYLTFLLLLAAILSGCASSTNAAVSTVVPVNTNSAVTESAAVESGPVCTSPADPTIALTEGPYYKAGSPERSSLIDASVTGTHLAISGFVLDTACQPVANARIEVWQANAQGQYDNTGYTLRGHLFTDEKGYYQFETIVPGLYPGRTEHIHIKVIPPTGPELTTQFFFPDAAQNQSDGIFEPSMLLNIKETSDGLSANFNFIVSTK